VTTARTRGVDGRRTSSNDSGRAGRDVERPQGTRPESRTILETRVDATSYGDATLRIIEWARARESRYVCVSAVNNVMHAHDDARFRDVMNGADLSTPDGMPLVWGLRWLGIPDANRVYGPDLTRAVLTAAESAGLRVGFYGGSAQVLDALVVEVHRRWPALTVAFAASPPYRSLTLDEDETVWTSINSSGTRIVFVGLGCPKQETWMAEHRGRVEAVMVGVGAAFDFLAGSKRQAPPRLQRAGLEWLFRLVTEPKRLLGRYVRQNPRFAMLFVRQIVRTRIGGRSTSGRESG
jgi:N-acetylglucosaminyldiphosphoundecaprenol N-acetyl-beta-D-mannosaminyltransferase